MDNLLLLDGGDLFARTNHNTRLSSLQQRIAAETAVDGLNHMGYGAMAVGEGEHLFGAVFLESLIERAHFPFVSASMLPAEQGGQVPAGLLTAAVIDVGHVRVGVTSVLGATLQAYLTEHATPGEDPRLLATVAAMQRGLALVEGEVVDVKVLLAHMPFDELAATLPLVEGFDVVLSSHESYDHLITDPVMLGGAAVLRLGWDGKYVGRLDLHLDAEGGVQVTGSAEVALDREIPDHPAMVALQDHYLERVAAEAEAILEEHPQDDPPSGGRYVGTAVCAECHEEQAAHWSEHPHSGAWQTLVDLRRDYDPSCFACHTTGFGWTGGFRLPTETPDRVDVGCESCHGAGAVHSDDSTQRIGPPTAVTCMGCHTEVNSPQFDLDTYWPQVVH